MTQPSQYRLGVIAYVGVCLLVYALIAYFHKPLLPLVRVLAPELYQAIDKSMSDGSLPYPLVVIFSAAMFVVLMSSTRIGTRSSSFVELCTVGCPYRSL